MREARNLLGTHYHELETPALVVDIAAMERNQTRMTGFCSKTLVHLRPHVKSHRSPDLARKQIAAGAQGICCGSLAEAEVMIEAGIDDVLVTREIAHPAQFARAARLAGEARLIVVVDDADMVAHLDRAAQTAGTRIGVLVDVDLGLERSGVAPYEPARRLAQAVDQARGLEFLGLMGYEGSMHQLDAARRADACRRVLGDLVATRELIERDGLDVAIVSSGATSTYRTSGLFAGITEIQPGSYLLGDAKYRHTMPEFETALMVLTTVISCPKPGRITVDAGQKKLTANNHLAAPHDPGLQMVAVNEEHGLIDVVGDTRPWRVGDRLNLIPWHCGTTVNLYDRIYGLRDERIVEVWNIAARGA